MHRIQSRIDAQSMIRTYGFVQAVKITSQIAPQKATKKICFLNGFSQIYAIPLTKMHKIVYNKHERKFPLQRVEASIL